MKFCFDCAKLLKNLDLYHLGSGRFLKGQKSFQKLSNWKNKEARDKKLIVED